MFKSSRGLAGMDVVIGGVSCVVGKEIESAGKDWYRSRQTWEWSQLVGR